MKRVKPEQIDALLPFLDKFDAVGFSAGTWLTLAPGHCPCFHFDEVVLEFIHVLYDNDWVTPQFDWGEWQESAQQYIEHKFFVFSASLAFLLNHVGYPIALFHRFRFQATFSSRDIRSKSGAGAVVRAGASSEGLPIGVQLVARPWREDVSLALARVVESALGGWQKPAL